MSGMGPCVSGWYGTMCVSEWYGARDEAIMLLIFPIMLFHNALEYVLLCQ